MVGDLKYGRTVHCWTAAGAVQGREVHADFAAGPGDARLHRRAGQPQRQCDRTEKHAGRGSGGRGRHLRHTRAERALRQRRGGRRLIRRTSRSAAPSSTPTAVRIPSSCTLCRATAGRGPTIWSTDLNHDPRLAIFRQTDNGIPIRMAIFAVLLGVEGLVSIRCATTWQHPSQYRPRRLRLPRPGLSRIAWRASATRARVRRAFPRPASRPVRPAAWPLRRS